MKRKTIGSVLIVLGVVLILAALGLVAYNIHEDNRAGKAARESLAKLVENIPQETMPPEGEKDTLLIDRAEIEIFEQFPYMDMPEQEVDGRMYIGVLEIPALELTLPIISQWDDYESTLAPCRYTGSAYMDDLVIAGHNYVNHFWRLQELALGDTVQFTDVDGNVFVYQMVDIEILNPDQIEEMCTGDWDMTLFTCTVGGQQRIAIRCEKQAK